MEKKITIKLFEDFQQDIKVASARVVEICNYVLKNYNHGFNADNSKIGDFEISYNIPEIEEPGDWVDYTLEIESNYDDFNESIAFEMRITNHGGYETRSQDQESPAEYADDEFDFEIDKLYYSKYYNESASQANDIDYMDLTDVTHISELTEKTAKEFISDAI